MTRRMMTIERTFNAAIEDVWTLWTTAEGIESWWGPDGFRVKVQKLELRAGGAFHYDMIAAAPEQISFMKKAGMPLSNATRATFTEVAPPRRLAIKHLVDFVPGVEPYETSTIMELAAHGADTRLTLTLETMHDEQWTKMAVMGWESQLGKLVQALAQKKSA